MGEIAPEGLPVEGEPVVEEAPWTGPSQEDWTGVQETLQALTPLVQQWNEWQNAPEEEEGAAPAGDYDPFEPESIRALIREELGPIQQYTQAQQMGEAEERAMDILTDISGREGEFLFDQSKGLARELANRYIGETQQKFGFGPKAAEAALERAYKDVRAWEDAVGKAYHERQVNQLSTLGQARREPAAAGTVGADQRAATEGGTEIDLVRQFFPAARGA